MQNQTAPIPHGVPEDFYRKFGRYVTAVLSGFDRIRFRGTLRMLFNPAKMDLYLGCCGVLLKEFGSFAEQMTARVKEAAYQTARKAGRPVQYLNSGAISKEELARQIAQRDKIDSGLIALFTTVEPCLSYSVRKDRAGKQIKLVLETRKCTHLYHYYLHQEFGLMHVRVQSWFPFTVDICLNARHWLARQLAQAGISFEQRANCLIQVADAAFAQKLLDQQLRTDWSQRLDLLLAQAHPLEGELCKPMAQRYYWSVSESEFATDVCFKDAASLAKFYPQFLHHGIRSFSSADVLRFLGKRAVQHCQGEIKSTLKHRTEGVRIRHTVNGNSIKVYDKEGSVLRVETTIVHPGHFKVFRPVRDQQHAELKWQRLRCGVADLWRRAQVSAAANSRYLQALASGTGTTPLYQKAQRVCRPIFLRGKRYRALNPWSAQDGTLLEAINRGEFSINGLRNRDLQKLLYPSRANAKEQLKRSACLTRKLALLRAHGLIRKVSGTHRYVLTSDGRTIITALLTARRADVDQLTRLAA
jgi:hypothetical protein